MPFIIIRRMVVGRLRRNGRSRLRSCTWRKPGCFHGLWREPAIFCGMSRWLMVRIRLGFDVCILKWMVIGVRLVSWHWWMLVCLRFMRLDRRTMKRTGFLCSADVGINGVRDCRNRRPGRLTVAVCANPKASWLAQVEGKDHERSH